MSEQTGLPKVTVKQLLDSAAQVVAGSLEDLFDANRDSVKVLKVVLVRK